MPAKLHGAALTQKVRGLAFNAAAVAPSIVTASRIESLTRALHTNLKLARLSRNSRTRARAVEKAAVAAGRLTQVAHDIERQAREARGIARRAARMVGAWP